MAKTYLSRFLALLCVVSFSVLGISAQVPPRPGVVGQRDEEKPRKNEQSKCLLLNGTWGDCKGPLSKDSMLLQDSDLFDFSMMSTAYIRFSQEPLSIEFVADDGKQATILFTEDGVTYSGDVAVNESAKLFFDLFWTEYILEQHLKAKCEQTHKEKR